jgi:hypothetical protein
VIPPVVSFVRRYILSNFVLWKLAAKTDIGNKPSFRLEQPGISDGHYGSNGKSYPLTENQMRPVTHATGRVTYIPCGGHYTMPHVLATRPIVYDAHRSSGSLPLLCVRNKVTVTEHPDDTYVTLFAGLHLRCRRLPNA